MKIHTLTVAEYSEIQDEIHAIRAFEFDSWPITVGTHPDYPGGPILIGHVEDGAFLIKLDDPVSADRQGSEQGVSSTKP